MSDQLKEVEALRAGSYDGHRRRAGARFFVRADAQESWFVEIGPAPEGAELPGQLQNGQAPRGKSFVEVMEQLKQPQRNVGGAPKEQTLAEGSRELPVYLPSADEESLV